MRRQSLRDLGPPQTSRDVVNMRNNTADMLRAMGQPVVHLHAWNPEDETRGKAKACPGCSASYNRQPRRRNCEICFGTGLVSTEIDPTHWVDSNGYLTTTPTDIPAPKWGGYDEPTLTRILYADVPTDVFQTNSQGVMIRKSLARSTAFWTPLMGDSDLIVATSLARDGITINDVGERYELHQVQPSTLPTIRSMVGSARDRVGQTFEMARLDRTTNDNQYRIPVGGVAYGLI